MNKTREQSQKKTTNFNLISEIFQLLVNRQNIIAYECTLFNIITTLTNVAIGRIPLEQSRNMTEVQKVYQYLP